MAVRRDEYLRNILGKEYSYGFEGLGAGINRRGEVIGHPKMESRT